VRWFFFWLEKGKCNVVLPHYTARTPDRREMCHGVAELCIGKPIVLAKKKKKKKKKKTPGQCYQKAPARPALTLGR
jgi:hypothetical protein